MEKPTRKAACEPCRQLKLACDHTKPHCTRCVHSGRSDTCFYREKPFKKRRRLDNSRTPASPTQHEGSQDGPQASTPFNESQPVEHHYPNAGHLGLSSHATIFNRLPADDTIQLPSPAEILPLTPRSQGRGTVSSNQHTRVLEDVLNIANAESLKSLVDFWLAKQTNLTLGGPFVESCKDTLHRLVVGKLFRLNNVAAIAQQITLNSTRSLDPGPTSLWKDLNVEISGTNLRWESISLALIVAGRASTDISFFPPLYTCRTELRAFQRSVTDLSDRCLETALLLDSMNEVQLICQYENFILHSVIDGDQSYTAWRRLGDVISSLLFLGLNEQIKDSSTTPPFLTELRRSTFAQIYSDDKNVAVFLGRPPRLNRKFCFFQLPTLRSDGSLIERVIGRPTMDNSQVFFSPHDQLDSVTGLRWTACCASLKEEVLEALQECEQVPNGYTRRFATIRSIAENLWTSLPYHLKLQGSIRSHQDHTPFQRDLLLGIRLTYLQVLFLLRNSVMIHGHSEAYDEELEQLQISQEMLSLIVEAIVLRGQLENSGTSLLWKVAHYGLPAAGVICLSMLRPTFWQSAEQMLPVPKILQELGVIAAEGQIGGLLQVGDPNYALLHRATSTIQSLLRAAFSKTGPIADMRRVSSMPEYPVIGSAIQPTDTMPLNLSSYTDFWGCEYDFWQDLGEHPSLLAPQI